MNSCLRKESRLIVISGPTAVGKTAASVQLAKRLETEIISADSMQVYRGMNIGTAKITKEEMQGIPHSLIDVVDVTEDYNVTRFQEMAEKEIDRVQSQGRIPIVCGGTGFYIQALIYGISFPEETDNELREKLHNIAEREGKEVLWEKMRELDPEYASIVPAENVVKVVRALEYMELHQEKFSDYNKRQSLLKKQPKYETKLFVLTDDTEKIYQRINCRVDQMLDAGLIPETEQLLRNGLSKESTAMQAIGYRQIAEYLEGQLSLEEAVRKIKKLTRLYAKKQITWYKKEPDVNWIHVGKGTVTNQIFSELWEDVKEACK